MNPRCIDRLRAVADSYVDCAHDWPCYDCLRSRLGVAGLSRGEIVAAQRAVYDTVAEYGGHRQSMANALVMTVYELEREARHSGQS